MSRPMNVMPQLTNMIRSFVSSFRHTIKRLFHLPCMLTQSSPHHHLSDDYTRFRVFFQPYHHRPSRKSLLPIFLNWSIRLRSSKSTSSLFSASLRAAVCACTTICGSQPLGQPPLCLFYFFFLHFFDLRFFFFL